MECLCPVCKSVIENTSANNVEVYKCGTCKRINMYRHVHKTCQQAIKGLKECHICEGDLHDNISPSSSSNTTNCFLPRLVALVKSTRWRAVFLWVSK